MKSGMHLIRFLENTLKEAKEKQLNAGDTEVGGGGRSRRFNSYRQHHFFFYSSKTYASYFGAKIVNSGRFYLVEALWKQKAENQSVIKRVLPYLHLQQRLQAA